MSEYFLSVNKWIMDPHSWLGMGPVWQIIGIVLAFFTILQLFNDNWAGGKLFSKKAMWITLILDALWVFMVFVAPFIPVQASIALIVVVVFVVFAVLAKTKWQ